MKVSNLVMWRKDLGLSETNILTREEQAAPHDTSS